MTTVSILSVTNDEGSQVYQAIAGSLSCSGKTPGEALDAITAELGDSESNTLVVLQNGRPDGYFSEPQRRRMNLLMQKWRSSRDIGTEFNQIEQAELDTLVQAELQATGQRAKAMADSMSK